MATPYLLRIVIMLGLETSFAIEVREVKRRLGDFQLGEISLKVSPGSVICLIGPSGSGKSTLLRCMGLLEEIDCGSIYVNDVLAIDASREGDIDLASPELRPFRKQIGFVFQQFHLWPHMTVLENVIEAPLVVERLTRRQAQEAGMESLLQVRLQNRAHDYPETLSGGEIQRAAIARALAMGPGILLLDEITSSLDIELIAEVQDILLRLGNNGTTMVLVTHELRFAESIADRLIFMDGGKILEAGTTEEILK